MMEQSKELIVIGDRVLISPEDDTARTSSGLYLPQGVSEKEQVQSGYVVKVGPGHVLPHMDSSEPWLGSQDEPQYVPLQVKEGDHAIFLRKEAIEIEYEKEKYLIVSQSGILAVVREAFHSDEIDEFS